MGGGVGSKELRLGEITLIVEGGESEADSQKGNIGENELRKSIEVKWASRNKGKRDRSNHRLKEKERGEKKNQLRLQIRKRIVSHG